MKVEKVRNVTTANSAITTEVTIRISVFDLKDEKAFPRELAASVIKAIEGIGN